VILACGVIAALIARIYVARLGVTEVPLHLGAIIVAGLVAGWAMARLIDVSTAKTIVRRSRRWLMPGESMVIVAATADRAPDVIEIVNEVVGEHPAIFALYPQPDAFSDPVPRLQGSLGDDAIHPRAVRLASVLKNVRQGHPSTRSLIPRISECERTIRRVQTRLASAVQVEEGIALSAEWVLDNAYVVQGHMEDFRRNLPASFFRELPYVNSGPQAGQTRVYCIAAEMVSVRDGRLSREGIESFLQTFQSETTLTTGELWALPMMLRLRLIEYLATLCTEVERRQTESELASLWSNRLLYTARREPGRIPELIAAMSTDWSDPTPHLVEELLSHLYDEEAALTPVRSWLQTKFPSPLEEVVRQDEQLETADQVSLANAISTLRLLSQIDWREVFEAVSHVEASLWTDPAMLYGRMDFATRDQYRQMVEELSKRGRVTEETVAHTVLELARKGATTYERHVGYYLIDAGLPDLLDQLNIKPLFHRLARRWTTKNAARIYVLSVAFVTVALVVAGLMICQVERTTSGPSALLTLLLLLPAASLAVQIVNYAITRTLKPHPLPKMSFEGGIPDQYRTISIGPSLWSP
jgi:hypothetical protein